jgi:pimeloyl-ACP methyl ester carboxylesterase
MSDIDLPPSTQSGGGLHISRGVTLRIPQGGLIVHTGAQGTSMEVSSVELQLDTCVHWLDIALEHLAAAKQAHDALLIAHSNGSEIAVLLDREFKHGLQAAVATATFFEALYAATVQRTPKPPPTTSSRIRPRSSRKERVAEQLRRAFGLRERGTANLRSVLFEIYRFRDEAVHPSNAFSQPILHPQLQVGVERRFVMFGYDSAKELVRGALAFSKILPSRDMTKQPAPMQEFAAYLLKVCNPLYLMWEQEYGPLLDETPATAEQ